MIISKRMHAEISPNPAIMNSLGHLSIGRDNNLNLLRFAAATAVIYSHSFGISGRVSTETFFSIFGIGLGDIGVDAFFVISGFLVTKSICSKSLRRFAWARILRIYPALWASSLAFVGVVGLLLSPLPALEFWTRRDSLLYILRNATMFPGLGAETRLPFAFDAVHAEFNTSLWTLPHELQMYVLLCLLSVIGALRLPAILVGVACLGGIGFVGDLFGWFHLFDVDRARFVFMFFSGSSCYLFREHIPMSAKYFVVSVVALVVAAALTSNHIMHRVLLATTLPFLTLWLGFVPAGCFRRFNQLGDYSYGMYIFACPIQFYLADRCSVLSPWSLFASSMFLTLPLAIVSWHCFESRALLLPLPDLITPLLTDYTDKKRT